MNNFSITSNAAGPWWSPPGVTAPWPPRASAAVISVTPQIVILAGV